MKKKLFLTSAIAMGVVAPAFAETFPSDGYMKENKTYDNAATADNMDDVYEGTVNAVAEYDIVDYILSAGQYLPADSETPTTCPAGSFCAGGTFQYDEENDQGLTSCPTIDNTVFTSASGSSAVTACYQDSAKSSAELNPFTTAHLNTNKNTDGYINGVKYANATTTARRYATTATTAGEWAALNPSDLEITDLACVNGWHLKSGVNGSAIATAIGNEAGINSAAIKEGLFSEINYDGQGSMIGRNLKGQTYYGLTDNNTWAVDYGDKGFLYGQGRCSTRAGASNTWGGNPYTYNVIDSNFVSSLTDESDKSEAHWCYCNLTGYKDASGNLQSLNTPWVYTEWLPGCADCAFSCAAHMRNPNISHFLPYRAAMFNAVQPTPAICEANTITINWSNADAEDISANNAGTATYGSDVRTPVKAETIKGKTFKGWKFSKPTTTQLPE